MRQRPLSPWEPLAEKPITATRKVRGGFWIVLARGLILGLVGTLIAALLAVLAALSIYAYYAASLPSPHELHARSIPFKSTKIYDRHGQLLFEVFDPSAGRRTIVRYDDIPSVVIHATVATEDGTFFSNPGVNPFSIVRALYQDLRYGEVVYGGSTITQQLVKNVYLGGERTLERKVKEAILAAEITRRYSKGEILEVYLNEVYYGNLAYGIGAAAETYFGKQVSALNLAEAALLAGLLQSPALYDPYTNPDSALGRRATVLRMMRGRGYIGQAEMEAAHKQPLGVIPRTVIMEAPHMVMAVREQLEKQYGTEMLYKGGLQVYTTLDLAVQRQAEQVAKEKIASLREQNATNTALVAMDPKTGDVLAMLGSVDFYNRQIGGQVNVARMPRQPGSTIKPFTYLAALERGWTPATMIMDVAQAFPDGANPPYKPTNYDDKEYGPESLRTALACSRNIPAVSTLYQIGLPALLEATQRLGITSLKRPDYGLSLTLGGGEVTLLEMTAAYAALANGGRRVTPRTILRIEDQTGKVILAQTPPEMPLVVDPRRAYLLTDILADDKARLPALGANSPLKLSFPAAAKTGTTNDYRDSWTIGYAPSLVTGVWVGNNENAPMTRLSGARGAALIWHDLMERALGSKPHESFRRPEGIEEAEVCPVSGQRRGETCPPPRKELFLSDNLPKQVCGVHQRLAVCQVSGKLAAAACPRASVEMRAFENYGAEWDTWARNHGAKVPPRETCDLHAAPIRVSIEVPSGPVMGQVEVRGTTEVADFRHYAVEYGQGQNPLQWGRITPEITSPVYDGVLCRWDTAALPDGVYAVRVVVSDRRSQNHVAKAVVEVRNRVPSPQPTQTPLASATPPASPTPQPSATPTRLPPATPTWTATASPTASPTAQPSATATRQPTMSPTSVPTRTSTLTPTVAPKPLIPPQSTAQPMPSLTLSPTVGPTQTPPER